MKDRRQFLIWKSSTVFLLGLCLIISMIVPIQASSLSLKTQNLTHPLTLKIFSQNPKSLTVEPAGKTPPALRILKNGELLGYLFSTYAVSGSLGFSGKPIDIHVGLSLDGQIKGARIVRHQEPILVLGIAPKVLDHYVKGFAGVDISARLVVGKKGSGLPDIVSGATISSGVIRDTIIRSARQVAFGYNLFQKQGQHRQIDRTTYHHKSWPELYQEGAVISRRLTLGEVGKAFGETVGDNPEGTFIDLYMALLTPPTIGQNLLKQLDYNDLVSKAGIQDHYLMIAANGLHSFRGRKWRKSGVFDRIEIIQGTEIFQFTKRGYKLIDRLHAAGAPSLREVAIYTLTAQSGFDPALPFSLRLRVLRNQKSTTPKIKIFALTYRLPEAYILSSGKTETKDLTQQDPQLWQQLWYAQKFNIAFLINMLVILIGILFFQDSLTSRKELYLKSRTYFLLATLLFLGFYAGAQLSVLNVITFIHTIMNGFRWELFLLNPLVFILWGFVAVGLLFWGRGVYCGWLCPFGALQELINIAARKLNIRQIRVPWMLHERLWPLKYIFFLGLLAISMSSMAWTFSLAEVEPFKTVIILKFMRSWPFILYALLLLVAGLFIERFYCRYLCPLGAALAIPARMRMFEWLKRRHLCGHGCNICAANCTMQAIHPLGQINPNECIYCLRCEKTYYDSSVCKALKKRAARSAKKQTSQ